MAKEEPSWQAAQQPSKNRKKWADMAAEPPDKPKDYHQKDGECEEEWWEKDGKTTGKSWDAWWEEKEDQWQTWAKKKIGMMMMMRRKAAPAKPPKESVAHIKKRTKEGC